MENEVWSGHESLKEMERSTCFRALQFAWSHKIIPLLSSFSSSFQIKAITPSLVATDFYFLFSIEEFQEKDHAWKSPFHYLWTEAAEKCSEKWHPKVKKREMVLHLLLSLTSIPLLNLEYLVSLPLCGCFHLCNCVGVTTLNSAAVLRLSFAYSFVTPTLFHLKDLLAAGESLWEYLNACPGTVISEFSRRATNW